MPPQPCQTIWGGAKEISSSDEAVIRVVLLVDVRVFAQNGAILVDVPIRTYALVEQDNTKVLADNDTKSIALMLARIPIKQEVIVVFN